MRVLDWGLVSYAESTDRQLRVLEEVRTDDIDRIIFCTHPAIVTVGRGTKDSDIFAWDGEVFETSRGGRATYHGPSQIVVYPIISLQKERANIPARDLHSYMRALELAIVKTLTRFGIQAESRQVTDDSGQSYTGVWVDEHKIASIGIAAKHWITYHGVALNVDEDPVAFSGINPCGFSSDVMTSMSRQLGKAIDRGELKEILKKEISIALAAKSELALSPIHP